MDSFFQIARQQWLSSFKEKHFRHTFIIGLFILACLASLLPSFYHYIENRRGIVLNDWLLYQIKARDVSLPIFIIIWGTVLFGVYRSLLSPKILLHFLYSYIFFIITRSICLLLVPLDPPRHIIELIDPVTNIFYGGSFVTKDLFYSGHTCCVVLLSLALERQIDKIIYFFLSFILAILLLLQHVHYTIDVLAAPVFAAICYKLGQFSLAKYHFFIK